MAEVKSADRSRTRSVAWLPLVVTALVVPTVLAGLTLLWPRTTIQDELTSTASAALSSAGFSAGTVSFSGRDATITGLPGADRQKAIDAVQAVTGVRVADFVASDSGTDSAPAGGAGTTPTATPFGIARQGDSIVLTGVVGSEEQRTELVAAATAKANGRQVVNKLTVTPGAAVVPGVDAPSVGAAAAALAGAASDIGVSVTAGKVTLTGTVADQATKAAVAGAVGAALPGTTIDNQLTISAAAGLDPAAKQQLQAAIAAALAAAPISFEPDSPVLTAQGKAIVAKVLELVRPAAGAKLQIDGYVAAGPGSGTLTAQQLSDQRAGAVRDALVAGGIATDRITAQGRGEGTTSATGASGRRVEITVV